MPTNSPNRYVKFSQLKKSRFLRSRTPYYDNAGASGILTRLNMQTIML